MKILHRVRIHAMDDSQKIYDALAFENDIIMGLGRFDALKAQFPDAKLIDGKGKTVLPAFIDPHIHFLHGAVLKAAFDCSPEKIPDRNSLIMNLKAMSGAAKPGDWIVGQGYDPGKFPGGKAPTRHDLDVACPNNPAVILHYSCHECIANTSALQRLEITEATPQPYGGQIERDRSGLTGRLIEAAFGPVMSHVVREFHGQLGEKLMERISEGEKQLVSNGIVRIGDPAVSSYEAKIYREALKTGALNVHVTVYPCSDLNFYGLPFDRVSDDCSLQPASPLCGPVKFFLDGADRAAMRLTIPEATLTVVETLKSAVKCRSLSPFRILLRSPGQLGMDFKIHLGMMMAKTEILEICVRKAVEKGYSVAFHALGNKAVEQALNIMERVPYPHPVPARIEHGVFLREKDIRALAQRKIAVVTQPFFLSHMGPDNLPPVFGMKILPLRSLMDAGVTVAGSSDWPVASLNPLEAIGRAVTRKTTGDSVLQPHEGITPEEAVSMYTRNAAAVLGQALETGSLEPGKRADFIILSDDPMAVDPCVIHKIHVEETYIGGVRVF